MRTHLRHLRVHIIFSLVLALTIGIADVAVARVFHCASGDVDCLIGSIQRANERAGSDRIILEAGTYALTIVNNTVDTGPRFLLIGGNGLPSITSRVRIEGAGATETIIDAGAGSLRAFHIATTGKVTLHGLTVQGGAAEAGGAIFNRGTLILSETVLRDNVAEFGAGGGAIYNAGTLAIFDSHVSDNGAFQANNGGIASSGSLTIVRSTIDHNMAEASGGIGASGITTIIDSTINDNRAFLGRAGGLAVSGVTRITNTTIASNSALAFSGGGLLAAGSVLLTNVTIADNSVGPLSLPAGGGIGVSEGAAVLLQNTIVARNTTVPLGGTPPVGPDCIGSIASLGNNVIGDVTDCTIDLAATDHVGDAGLGVFVDDGTPGGGHIPLLAESPAIDAGNRAACPRRDQLGQRRVDGNGDGRRFCDIGAVEFIP